MTIETTTDLPVLLSEIVMNLGALTGKPHDAAIAAISEMSPVVRIDQAFEAYYAAVIQGELSSTEARPEAIKVAARLAYVMVFFGWHNKAKRCGDIFAVLSAQDPGAQLDPASMPEVDEAFRPPAPLIVAPPSSLQ